MFSGIVVTQGVLSHIKPLSKALQLTLHYQNLGRRVSIGESVAVNGCCLTVVSNRKKTLCFDILQETWLRTCFHRATLREKVNLEPSLRLGDPVGGHLVTGHIDGVGQITQRKQQGSDVLLEIEPPPELMRWIVLKGSVAVDGVSLTVAEVKKKRFRVWLIPLTLKLTTLGWKREADCVNLEGDMLAKYAQNILKKS